MSRSNPTYRMKLYETFNTAYAHKSQEFRSKLRPILSNSRFRYYLAQNLIMKIQDNTADGKDKNGKTISTYAPYSSAYKKSLTFKIYGKTSKVNLTLTGDMLASIVDVKGSSGDIVLQFEAEENKTKAGAHIYGVAKKNLKKRDFFGLQEKEEVRILRESIKYYSSTLVREVEESIGQTRFE